MKTKIFQKEGPLQQLKALDFLSALKSFIFEEEDGGRRKWKKFFFFFPFSIEIHALPTKKSWLHPDDGGCRRWRIGVCVWSVFIHVDIFSYRHERERDPYIKMRWNIENPKV